MRDLPVSGSDKGVRFTLADFYEAGRERLGLSLQAGEDRLGCEIEEPVVSRPGLALTGFYEHFVPQRLLVIGKAEIAYLRSLPTGVADARVRALIARGARCLIFSKGAEPSVRSLAFVREIGLVVFFTSLKTRVFIHRSAFVLGQLGAPRTTIWGTMVEVFGMGVLLEGCAGLGKSETALGLIRHGHSLVADDLTCVRKDVANDVLLGSASDSTAGYMEIRGLGIVDVAKIFGVNSVCGETPLQLVVSLRRMEEIEGEVDRIGQTRRTRDILGVSLPEVMIPVSVGRDLVNLVETAVQHQKLLAAGCDSVASLRQRLHRRADVRRDVSVFERMKGVGNNG